MKRLILVLLLLTGMASSYCEYYTAFYSSFIRSATYCPLSDYGGELILDLNGREYSYYISYETWLGFKDAPSKGSYYHRYIK
jgi:hypothetical protein